MRAVRMIALVATVAGSAVAWPGNAGAASGVRSPLLNVRNVKEIGRDLLAGPPGSEDDTAVEPDIAMDPNDPTHVAAVYQEGRFQDGGAAGIGWATSRDGGRTWTFGDLPGLTVATGGPFDRATDPSVAFGPDHSIYAGSMVLSNGGSCPSGTAVNRSDDGGLTWNLPVFVDRPSCPTMDDKTWLTVDTFPSSPHVGRIYFVWDQSPPTGGLIDVMKWSDDRGQTWSQPVTVADAAHAEFPVAVLVQPNGDVSVQWTPLKIRRSHDGGQSWGPYGTIDTFQGHDPSGIRTGGGFGIGSAAVDPVTGRLYVAWQDGRMRTDGLNDILLRVSLDGGATWRGPVRVNADPVGSGIDHFDESVAAYGGDVHVAYLARLGTGPTLNQDYTMSTDGGRTFGPEIQLGPPLKLQWAAEVFFDGTKFLGDYFAMAAGDGVAHPVWVRPYRPQVQQPYHQTAWSGTIFGF